MPHDQLKQEIVAKIEADIVAKQAEIEDLRALRDHVLRFDGKSNPNETFLSGGETDAASTSSATSENSRAAKQNGKPRVALKIGIASASSNRGMFRAILRDTGKSMTAQQVWPLAVQRGASTNSPNPLQATHAGLAAMVGKGVKRTGKGKYAYDPATAPSEEDSSYAQVPSV